jgi:hypothetical protein
MWDFLKKGYKNASKPYVIKKSKKIKNFWLLKKVNGDFLKIIIKEISVNEK